MTRVIASLKCCEYLCCSLMGLCDSVLREGDPPIIYYEYMYLCCSLMGLCAGDPLGSLEPYLDLQV